MNTRYRATRYFTSAYSLDQLPPDGGREVAFTGRSNVGKSSCLNTLTWQKGLARVSRTPGRTQMINFFQVTPDCYLVDLPGYGYAKVPEALRRHWQTTIQRYLNSRQALRGLFLLMDVRHPLTVLDGQLLAWCEHQGLPVHVLLTKADKLSRGAALAALRQVEEALQPQRARISVQLFSALKRTGIDAACAKLDEWLNLSAGS